MQRAARLHTFAFLASVISACAQLSQMQSADSVDRQ